MSKLAQAKTDLRFFQKMVSENERRLSYWFISDRERKNTEKELKQLRNCLKIICDSLRLIQTRI